MVVDDINRALNFFTDILGFETLVLYSNYAYVHRETAGFRVLEQKGPEGAPPGNRRFAYYIDVHDVDQLYTELKPKLDTLRKRMSMGRSTSPIINESCWYWHRMETCSHLDKQSPRTDSYPAQGGPRARFVAVHCSQCLSCRKSKPSPAVSTSASQATWSNPSGWAKNLSR